MSSVAEIRQRVERLPATDSAGYGLPGALWITWHLHRRTSGLCAAWSLPLRVIRSGRRGPLRWLEQAGQTLVLLHRQRPRILFIQNPSLALTVLAFLARPLFGYYLVIDAHNEGVRPFDRPGAFVRWLTRQALGRADLTLVTNDALAPDVRAAGGRPLVLPDSLPVPPEVLQATRKADAPEVVVIATFRRDEPIDALLAAAAQLPGVRFAVTGDAARFRPNAAGLPANVRLTGFLPDREYWELLAGADVVCDLTLKPDCLVCGAYEALAVGKPMVLSDNAATRELFGSAAILTSSEPGEIARALRTALERRDTLALNARALRATYRERWQAQASAVLEAVRAGAAPDMRGNA
jgi:glycosyltransferase involved in cell wall biosynthesis